MARGGFEEGLRVLFGWVGEVVGERDGVGEAGFGSWGCFWGLREEREDVLMG